MIKYNYVGDSPSGKAVGSGPTIRGFESLIPSHLYFIIIRILNKVLELYFFMAFGIIALGIVGVIYVYFVR